jgi:hypothetical protein
MYQSQHLRPLGNTTSKLLGEVTMVTNGGAQAESGISYTFIVKHTHTISVHKHVFRNLHVTLFIHHTACELKRACSMCTPGHMIFTKLCYPGDAASKCSCAMFVIYNFFFFTSGNVITFEVVFLSGT